MKLELQLASKRVFSEWGHHRNMRVRTDRKVSLVARDSSVRDSSNQGEIHSILDSLLLKLEQLISW